MYISMDDKICKRIKDLLHINNIPFNTLSNFLNMEEEKLDNILNGNEKICISDFEKICILFKCPMDKMLDFKNEFKVEPSIVSLLNDKTVSADELMKLIFYINNISINIEMMEHILINK
ncbi:hypothetical protein JFP838_pA0139 (plasmid) [Clostridium perfringens]|uniref:HTH cro/C1-type domain-containing protein n=2 Tax=Clostridium perfringens TaxID=1502 RepID=A0A140GR96_CLOPF|nr:hypothetical protein [Clostridium perfringens]AMN31055.1 hypothetical protein JFP838_pA0139 [Clostridium perfringens]